MSQSEPKIPIGTKALIFSKLYYGVLSKSLEKLDIERYYSVLYFLKENNGCNQQHICNHLAVDKTAMVKVINYLIKADYVERNVNPKDRREHFVTLTKKGWKYMEQIVKAFQAIDDEIFSSITPQEQEAFVLMLNKLSANLSNLPSNDLFFNYKKSVNK
jgi:DNA-binding MarR family transcriptional regulator